MESQLINKDESGLEESEGFELASEPLIHPLPPEPGPAAVPAAPPAPNPARPQPLSLCGDLHLIGRDPRWLFAFWDREDFTLPASCQRLEIRVCSPDGTVASSTPSKIDETHWLLPVPAPGGSFFAEIGWFAPEVGWQALSRSEIAQAAPDGPSADESAAFGLVPFSLAFERLKALAAMAGLKNLSLPQLLEQLADGLAPDAAGVAQEAGWTTEQRRLLKTLLDELAIERFAGDSSAIERLFRRGLQEIAVSEEELFSRERWDHLLRLAGGSALEGGS